jgi:hypothetical protein
LGESVIVNRVWRVLLWTATVVICAGLVYLAFVIPWGKG